MSPASAPAVAGCRIVLERCTKHFGTQRVLDPLDLEIRGGETLVLLGPSGCGKTTLLRVIAGLEWADSGRVWFDGEDVTQRPIEDRQVGMVFQSYALFPNMNVAQNVEYGLRVRGLERSRRRVRVQEMLAMMRLEDLAERRVDQLVASGNASPWPAPWLRVPGCCCSTSR
jgi:putative spermidine/putrescine transport system ATP-binding protein